MWVSCLLRVRIECNKWYILVQSCSVLDHLQLPAIFHIIYIYIIPVCNLFYCLLSSTYYQQRIILFSVSFASFIPRYPDPAHQARKLIESSTFQGAIVLCIVFNTCLLCLDSYPENSRVVDVTEVTETRGHMGGWIWAVAAPSGNPNTNFNTPEGIQTKTHDTVKQSIERRESPATHMPFLSKIHFSSTPPWCNL